MIQEILDTSASSTYDFRHTACDGDPLRHLFPEWVSYYRTKWAIARVLRPKRILEIGVRFGYSALAFLDACPGAQYLGIDLNTNTFGGDHDAIFQARKACRGLKADFVIADSQRMTSFPGGSYDLIHIDGQQDENGIMHDLMLALAQARYVLVDGYLWTRENFLAASEFLYRYRDEIEYYFVIPGYAGDLLVRPKAASAHPRHGLSSRELRPLYTHSYFMTDCGGFDSFKRSGGFDIADSRLSAVAQIADVAPVGRAVDLGCGRGEIALHLAKQGHEVLAVDYSKDAISLAVKARDRADSKQLAVEFRCEDVNETALSGFYELAVASDLIEHMAPDELEKLYSRVAEHLGPDGLFVIHTFPNGWFYRYEYLRRLRIARRVGAYLPLEPRSRYEKLMHINEQSPKVLKQQLLRHFPRVRIWFARHDCLDPLENLRRPYSISDIRAAGDVFAVASHSKLDESRLLECSSMYPCDRMSRSIGIRILAAPITIRPGDEFPLRVFLSNGSSVDMKSYPPNPVHLSYHWIDRRTGEVVVFDGLRTRLPRLNGGCAREFCMRVAAPLHPGCYALEATLVQEFVHWFSEPALGVTSTANIEVR